LRGPVPPHGVDVHVEADSNGRNRQGLGQKRQRVRRDAQAR
jgi:hypothetical protein